MEHALTRRRDRFGFWISTLTAVTTAVTFVLAVLTLANPDRSVRQIASPTPTPTSPRTSIRPSTSWRVFGLDVARAEDGNLWAQLFGTPVAHLVAMAIGDTIVLTGATLVAEGCIGADARNGS